MQNLKNTIWVLENANCLRLFEEDLHILRGGEETTSYIKSKLVVWIAHNLAHRSILIFVWAYEQFSLHRTWYWLGDFWVQLPPNA